VLISGNKRALKLTRQSYVEVIDGQGNIDNGAKPYFLIRRLPWLILHDFCEPERETSSPGLGNGIRCLSSETVVDGQGQKASWTVSLVYVLYSVNVDSVPLY